MRIYLSAIVIFYNAKKLPLENTVPWTLKNLVEF